MYIILFCTLIETVHIYRCRSTRIHYANFELISLCSQFLLLNTWRRSSIYLFNNLIFDNTDPQIHNLLHHYTADVDKLIMK
jgi:hypothetical protein